MQIGWTSGSQAYELAKRTYVDFQEQLSKSIDAISSKNRSLACQIGSLKYWIFDCDPRRCLAKRPLYVLGFNPSAAGDIDFTLPEHWDSLETWYDCPPRKESCLEKRIGKLVTAVLAGMPDEVRCPNGDIPRSTLYFFRTHKATDITNYKKVADGTEACFDCWDYHKRFLNLIRPSVILCYGNAKQDSTFSEVCRRLGDPLNGICGGALWYNHAQTRFAEIKTPIFGDRSVLLIGVPHPSRYDPEANCLKGSNTNRVLDDITARVRSHFSAKY